MEFARVSAHSSRVPRSHIPSGAKVLAATFMNDPVVMHQSWNTIKRQKIWTLCLYFNWLNFIILIGQTAKPPTMARFKSLNLKKHRIIMDNIWYNATKISHISSLGLGLAGWPWDRPNAGRIIRWAHWMQRLKALEPESCFMFSHIFVIGSFNVTHFDWWLIHIITY